MVHGRCGLLLGACVLLLAGRCPASANQFGGVQNQVVQFGTYDVTLLECFYQKILMSMASPQSVAFNNPAAKEIVFITAETEQGIDFGGIEASITTGTIGTSTSITLRVATTPVSLLFPNNVHVRMFCKP